MINLRIPCRAAIVAFGLSMWLGGFLPLIADAGSPRTYRISTAMVRELRLADQDMQTGRYQQAETRYRAILNKNPENTQARSALSLAQAALFKLDAAEKNAQQVLVEDPANALAHVAMGVVYRNRTASMDMNYRNHREMYLAQSARELERAIQLDPRSPEAHTELGVTYRFQGRIEEAQQEFERALKLDPTFAEALLNQGVAQMEQGNIAEAQRAYTQAIRLNSRNHMAHYRLGEALLKSGDPHLAIRSFNTALSLDPNNASVLAKLAEAYEQQGNTSAAVADYRKAIQSNPAFMPAYIGLSNLFDSRGDGELAMAELKSALNVNPKYNQARNQLGRLALTVDKPDQAIQYYKESLQHNPQDAEALQGLSQALTLVAQKTATASQALGQESDLVQAEMAIREALRLNPADLRLHLAALRISQLAGKPKVSEEELQAITQSPPHNDSERMVQAEALFALGRYDEADLRFREMISKAHGDLDKLLVMGDILKTNGNLDLASEAYRQAAIVEPGNLKAQRGIQRIEGVKADSKKNLRLGKALNNWRQKESSIDFYEESLMLNPRQPEARLALAKLYEKVKQYDRAAVSYQHYLGLMPNLREKERLHYQKKILRLQGLAQKASIQPRLAAQASR